MEEDELPVLEEDDMLELDDEEEDDDDDELAAWEEILLEPDEALCEIELDDNALSVLLASLLSALAVSELPAS